MSVKQTVSSLNDVRNVYIGREMFLKAHHHSDVKRCLTYLTGVQLCIHGFNTESLCTNTSINTSF